ncbi:MAG: 16S rRNA (guanine(1405)-N(7))-methyltransferase RmtF [Clostridia bacterium]|nr:16S rRNA (guanine(1405)-N(7))-methyltransferase RmtF [Clostridia bacterium]
MNESERACLEKALQSKALRDICPETVARVYEECLSRYKTPKEAERAARQHLHGIAGAYLSPEQMRTARKCLSEYRSGDASALARVLSLHASTRERTGAEAIYGRFFRGEKTVLDLACGFHPLQLGLRGLNVWGCDIHRGAVSLVNDFAEAAKLPVRAEARDLLSDGEYPPADAALLMKLLPLLERQKKGFPSELISRLPVRRMLVTFPSATISGKRVGMEKHYTEWFEGIVPAGWRIEDRFSVPGEICFSLSEA